ncbi:hypothetical protein ACIGEZ_09715 [Streptomyces sp. NPDC085481]|uniref:hypothetical protein n=1 Tax=Streptomyces sp. NPDC085481 TaxID=3365727 RepID=UPI0037D52C23
MSSEERPRDAAVRRLGRGLPLYRVLDVTRASAWTDLDEDVRGAMGRGAFTPRPDHSWLTADGLTADGLTAEGLTAQRQGGWRALLGKAPFGKTPTEAQLARALCAPDGRIREAALAHAARQPAVLPLVAIRTTDWAGPVREKARAVLAAALPTADPGTLAVTVPVLLRIRDRLRAGEGTALLDELLHNTPADTLTALLTARDLATRRLAIGIATRRGVLGPDELARIAASDADVAVQDRAATAVVASDPSGQTLAVLLGAPYGRVRAAGVTALRRAGRAADAEPFLYDRSGLVRACARWVLRQDGTDPLALYRTACADPGAVPCWAPLGLAECGDQRADLPALWALTGHERALVRSSAVAGLRVLEVADFGRLLPLLDDPAPGVVREAARALLPWADRLPEQELLRRTGPDRPAHLRIRAVRLLRANGTPAYDETARRLADDPDPVVRRQVRRALGMEEARPAGTPRPRLWRT